MGQGADFTEVLNFDQITVCFMISVLNHCLMAAGVGEASLHNGKAYVYITRLPDVPKGTRRQRLHSA